MLLAVCEARGLEYGCVPRVAAGLGGGMGHKGEACGAVTGGVLAIGLAYASEDPTDREAKSAVSAKVEQYLGRFAERNGALRCPDLLGVDLGTHEGTRVYRERNLRTLCDGFVSGGVRALLGLMDSWDAA